MIIGVPKEIKEQEYRVALLPDRAHQLVNKGHKVLVEKNAGVGAGFPDADYVKAGAKIVDEHADVFKQADMIVKVKEPLKSEYSLLRKGQILFTYLHLAANKVLTEAVAMSGVVGIAYETVQLQRRIPMLEPMSEIAGRMSPIVGANLLAKNNGGRGVLISGVPGVLPGRVLVVGGGTSGLNAARIAIGMGADVIILELDLDRMHYLELALPTVNTLYSSEESLNKLLPTVDMIIGAVLVPGGLAPKLITRAMLRQMRPGSVFIDIAVDQGGCAETSRPTTHDNPTFVEEGVIHYCVANMPGAYARTSTQALTNTTSRYVQILADEGLKGACKKYPELIGGINVKDGNITYEAVAKAHGLPYVAPNLN